MSATEAHDAIKLLIARILVLDVDVSIDLCRNEHNESCIRLRDRKSDQYLFAVDEQDFALTMGGFLLAAEALGRYAAAKGASDVRPL